MNDALPQGWIEATLVDVARLNMGLSPPSSTYNSTGKGLPFFQGKTEFGDLFPTPAKYCSEPSRIAEPNDILISVRAPVGPTNLCKEKCSIGRGLAAIRPLDSIPSLYLLYYIRSIEDWLSQQGTGSTFTAISKDDLIDLPVRIAPLPEQRRIVAKLEKLLDKVNASQRRLERIPQILKRFRQSVLAAACSGKLTEDWRGENPNVQSAEIELIDTIKRVAAKYEKDCLGAAREKGRKPIRPTCLDDYEPAWLGDEKIPEGWFESTLGKVCFRVTDGTHDTPKPVTTGVPFITGKHIRERRIDFDNCLFLPQEVHAEIFLRCNPKRGDVLLVNIGAGVATPALVRVEFEFSLENVALLKPVKGLLLGEYLEFYQLLMKPKIFDEVARGGAQPFMGLALIKTIPICLPPFNEQQEIVRRVEALFALADQIEARYTKAKAHVDKLTQSILAKAFRGELVPQDPNDEPASVLLERIRVQRANDQANHSKNGQHKLRKKKR